MRNPRRKFGIEHFFVSGARECDVFVCNLNSLILRGTYCDGWMRHLIPLIYIEMGMTEEVFNINT